MTVTYGGARDDAQGNPASRSTATHAVREHRGSQKRAARLKRRFSDSFGPNLVWKLRLNIAVLAQVVLHLTAVIVDRLHPAEQPVFDSRLIQDGTASFVGIRGESDQAHVYASAMLK